MLGPHRAVRLGLETVVEVPAVEEPGERVGLREPLQRFVLLLLHEARADVLCEQLERLEIALLEAGGVDRIGDVQHAAELIVDDDGDRDEGLGAVIARAFAVRGLALRPAHEDRALRRGDLAGDALAFAHADLTAHVLGETDRARDHEVGRVLLAEHERRALATDELRRDAEDGIEKILSTRMRNFGCVHQSPKTPQAHAPAILGPPGRAAKRNAVSVR